MFEISLLIDEWNIIRPEWYTYWFSSRSIDSIQKKFQITSMQPPSSKLPDSTMELVFLYFGIGCISLLLTPRRNTYILELTKPC